MAVFDPVAIGPRWMSPEVARNDHAVLSSQVRYEGMNGPSSVALRGPSLTQLYGPAVRCKPNLGKRRGLVLLICIRPLRGAFVLLAIMDIRAHPISFSERP
jgi:hypothetical protein